jgi:hypothetical protein
MTPEELDIASLYLEDSLRLIAAGKVQRWDVVKWTVTANFALAAASIALRPASAGGLFFVFSVLIAVAGAAPVYHYNRRMTGAREAGTKIENYLSANQVDVHSITGEPSTERPPGMYDAEELYIFGYIIGGSILPSFLAWVLYARPSRSGLRHIWVLPWPVR